MPPWRKSAPRPPVTRLPTAHPCPTMRPATQRSVATRPLSVLLVVCKATEEVTDLRVADAPDEADSAVKQQQKSANTPRTQRHQNVVETSSIRHRNVIETSSKRRRNVIETSSKRHRRNPSSIHPSTLAPYPFGVACTQRTN